MSFKMGDAFDIYNPHLIQSNQVKYFQRNMKMRRESDGPIIVPNKIERLLPGFGY